MDVKSYMEAKWKELSALRHDETAAQNRFYNANLWTASFGGMLGMSAGILLLDYMGNDPIDSEQVLLAGGSAILTAYFRIRAVRLMRKYEKQSTATDDFTNGIMRELEEELSSKSKSESIPPR